MAMTFTKGCLIAALAGMAAFIPAGDAGSTAAQEPPKVVVTIKPIHSLAAGVMEGIASPFLLIEGGASPHTYSLKPSEARALQEAVLVIRVSDRLETFLNKAIGSLAEGARILTLEEVDGMVLHEVRSGAVWDDHGHDYGQAKKARDRKGQASRHGHDPAKAQDDGHRHGHDHGHKKEARAHGHEAGPEAGHGHDHDRHDTHLWLDPRNAKTAVVAIAEALAKLDPERANAYQANAERVTALLETLDEELAAATRPLADKRYVVFHDAYQYFEQRYGLSAAGSITVSPERQPGAKRLSELRQRIQSLGATCVFAEPQFEPKLVRTVTDGTKARSGVLDPLGAALPAGPELYFDLMRSLAASLKDCLAS